MSGGIAWTTGRDGDEPKHLELQQVDTLSYRNLGVPVWTVTGYSSNLKIVRYDDLPTDLAEAFGRWQYGANVPFARAAYWYDFDVFMSRRGRPEDREVVGRYR